jgi:glycosyltransferase 2 family protein
MKYVKDFLKYSFFLMLGVVLFWYIYKDVDKANLIKGLRETNYFWIAVSITLGLLSHLSRAMRWNMLIEPMGYKPKLYNTFLSVLVMYLANLIVPRAGELARCTVLGKYEKIPVSKLVGTVIIERIADFLTLMVLGLIIFTINISIVREFFRLHPQINERFVSLLSISNILLGITVIALLIIIFMLVRPVKHGRFSDKFNKIKHEFKDGIKSILMLKNKWLFIGHTLLIFFIWLMMLYVVFLAYPPTNQLTIFTGMFTFLMGGLAMLAPVQGGIGPWHFMVIESLFLFGINKESGSIFALIAHSSTNLIYLPLGLLALALLWALNRKPKPHLHHLPKP